MSATHTPSPKRLVRSYTRERFKWEPLYLKIKSGCTQSDVAKKFQVSRRTLCRRYNDWCTAQRNKDANKVKEAIGAADGRKRSHRALSDAAEDKVYRKYKAVEQEGNGATSRVLVQAAIAAHHDEHPHITRSDDAKRFVASSSFIRGIKRRERISLGVVNPKFKPRTYLTDEERFDMVTDFLEKANDVLMRYTLDRIINCDETSGKIVSPVLHALRDVGSGAPKVETKTNPKSAVTLVGAVTSKGKKLNTAVIAKGKTTRSLNKFHLRRSTPGLVAPKGWMTGKAMIEWVDDVVVPYARGRPMCLICDDYPAHKTEAVRNHLDKHSIELLLVPSWSTGDVQPLDVGVFGPVKAKMRRLWTNSQALGQHATNTYEGVVRRFEKALSTLSPTAVKHAWAKAGIYDDEIEPEDE